MPCEILIPNQTRARLAAYETAVRSGAHTPGQRLAASLADSPAGENDYLTALLRTKLPQIFAILPASGAVCDLG